jgi:hypothetical protein
MSFFSVTKSEKRGQSRSCLGGEEAGTGYGRGKYSANTVYTNKKMITVETISGLGEGR